MLEKFSRPWFRLACAGLVATAGGLASTVKADEPQSIFLAQLEEAVEGDDDEEGEGKEKKWRIEVDAAEAKGPKVWLGVMLKEIEGDLATYLGDLEGVLIDRVYEESPAAEAGIKKGDVLIQVNDKKVAKPAELVDFLVKVDEGSDLNLSLLRSGEKLEVKVTPAERPAKFAIGRVFNPEDLDLELKFEGGELDESVMDALRNLKIGDDDVSVFRFGGPALTWRGKGAQANANANVIIKREVDGKDIEVKVTREDDEPATIIVTQDGETKNYTEEELEKLPKEIAVIVNPILEGGQGLIEVRSLPMKFEAIQGAENAEEMAKKIREMVEKQHVIVRQKQSAALEAAKKAREATQKIRETVRQATASSGKSQEIEELKSLVEELKQEVEALRSKLNDKDDA